MYPDMPRLELFARKARPGWTCWGNQISDPATPAPVMDAGDGLDIPPFLRRAPQ